MADPVPHPAPDQPDSSAEIARLNKMVQALIDRSERSTTARASDFNLFQSTILLQEQVRDRTAELEGVLRENEKINRALSESEAKLRGLVSQSMVGIAIVEDQKYSYSNTKFDEIFGYSADEVRDLGPLDLAVESDRSIVAESMRLKISHEVDRVDYVFRGRRKNGDVLDLECHSSGMDIAGKLVIMALYMDITERTRTEREVQALQERLRDESTHDALTGLYNRRYLEVTLERELILAAREGHQISVIMGDLDYFKAVNDHHGHLAGDEVLRVFANLMKRYARGSDICCRYGGEEFLLVLPKMEQGIAAERAEQLRSAMAAAPVIYDGLPIAVTASFGVATLPGNGRTRDELVVAADDALYAAKAAGRNRVHMSSVVVG